MEDEHPQNNNVGVQLPHILASDIEQAVQWDDQRRKLLHEPSQLGMNLIIRQTDAVEESFPVAPIPPVRYSAIKNTDTNQRDPQSENEDCSAF